MDKIPHTTVNLTDNAQIIKDDLAPIYGLKNILSAGLILFGQLTDSQQKAAIAAANGLKTLDPALAPQKAAIAVVKAAVIASGGRIQKVHRRKDAKSG